jgi:hypothetical protein
MLEKNNKKPMKKILGIEFSDEKHALHRSYIIGTLFSSIAFLEATINEIFQDAMETETGYLISFNHVHRMEIIDFWEKNQRASMIEKYNELLRIITGNTLNKGMEPYQSIKVILDFRNKLTHYIPTWISHSETYKYESFLKNKFPLNNLSFETDPFYPDRLLGAGFAQWVLSNCIKFADDLFYKIDIEPQYASVKLKSLVELIS